MGERPPASALERLNPDLMNPKRFLIATLLYVLGPRTMGELFKALGLTWGDLDSNIRRLRERGYVRTKKVLTLRGPRTLVELTEEGIREYERLVEELRELLEAVRRSAESDSRGRSESALGRTLLYSLPTTYVAQVPRLVEHQGEDRRITGEIERAPQRRGDSGTARPR